MKGFEGGKFTTIKDISDRRRLPRLGKVRLGYKVRNQNGMTDKCKHKEEEVCMFCSHPVETEYFVCPSEVREKYGEKPTELDVMLPVNEQSVIFPQRYIWYGQTKGPKCIGNGQEAQRSNNGEVVTMECPCEKLESGECTQRASLQVILPKVNMGGVYQIDTTSYHSIVDINSGMAYIAAMMKQLIGEERFAMIPLVLKRIARETHEGGVKGTHYTMHLHSNLDMKELVAFGERRFDRFALPAPEQVNPELDEEGIIDVEDEEKIRQGPLLPVDSALHRAIEAKLKGDGINREDFKKFKGLSSFKEMTVAMAKDIAENWPETMEAFIEWDQNK
jgi:hypothetical protein